MENRRGGMTIKRNVLNQESDQIHCFIHMPPGSILFKQEEQRQQKKARLIPIWHIIRFHCLMYFHYCDSAHVGKASFTVLISAVACESGDSGDKMRGGGGGGGGGCDFLERSLDREQNKLLLHIAPFKLFLFRTLRVLLAGCAVSGDNNQAWTRKGRQPWTVWRVPYRLCPYVCVLGAQLEKC